MILKHASSISDWLDIYRIKNYTLVPDVEYGFVVDVDDSVDLNGMNLNVIPVKFNIISGNFGCSSNKLISLKGSPKRVDGSFYCAFNRLTTLEHCPQHVGRQFNCSNNKLENLHHMPELVGTTFIFIDNSLISQYCCDKSFEELKLEVKAHEEFAMLSTALTNGKLPLVYKL